MMNDVHWRLGGEPYSDYLAFVQEVTRRNDEPTPHGWIPDKIVCYGPLKVRYEIPWKESGEDLIEFIISTSNEPITVGVLLYRLHNGSAEFFAHEHHCFFEGLGDPVDGTAHLLIGS